MVAVDSHSLNSTILSNSALKGLRALQLTDLQRYKHELSSGDHKAWCYYFPFMYYFSMSSKRQLLIDEDEGSLCIYFLRLDKEEPRLNLYFPPLPMNRRVLYRCFQRIHEFQQNKSASVIWVDEHDAAQLTGLPSLRVLPREEEYLYASEVYKDISGRRFRKLRQNLRKVNALDNVEVRPYRRSDAEICIALMEEWRTKQGEKFEGRADRAYSRYCLRNFDIFQERDLFGRVFLLDGEIQSFGFCGETHETMGNLFIGKSNHQIQGLNYFMQYHLILAMENYPFINNASDMGLPGLKFAKEHLRPVAMHQTFKVRQRGAISFD